MNPEPNQRQLDALEKYLRGELDASHPDLPAEEAVLARQLRAAVAGMQPAPQFVAALNKQLAEPQVSILSRRIEFRYLFSSLAGIAALILLAFLFRWLILSVAPQPPIPALPSTQTPLAATDTPPAPVTPEADQSAIYAPLFSESYSLEAGFPASPEQANLYEQVMPQTATVETARTLAAKFGLNGTLYLSPETGPNGEPVYMTTDGKQRLYIYSAQRYNYFPDWARMQETKDKAADAQFAVAQAEAFLKARNLLDFPYRVETSSEYPAVVDFVPTLDDLPVRYASGHQFARLEAEVASDGQVIYLSADLPAYQLVGKYPLRTVENSWDKVLGVSTDLGLMGDFGSSFPAEVGHIWLRSYPLNQPMLLKGAFEMVASAEGGDPFFALDNYPLVGNLTGLEQLDLGAAVAAQGQFIQDGEVQRFQVETWQKTNFSEFLAGSLEQVGERVFFLVEDGRRLELPDLPPEVFPAAQGEEFHASGVVDGDVFDWNLVQTGPLGGGGGGGGGLTSFAKLNLSGTPMPTATPQVIPTPLVADAVTGQRLDGASGDLNITIFESKDGKRRTQAFLNLDKPVNGLMSFNLVEGPGRAGIEKYHLQPVRVWGVVSGLGAYSLPQLTVERYEPLYPDLAIQGWVGKEKITTVQGKSVLLFTSEDGRAYIVRESLVPDFDPVNQAPGKSFIFVQGLLPPGEEWGGYPVMDIRRRTYSGPDDTTALDEMKKQFTGFEPDVIPEMSYPALPSGAKIEKIELVYLAKDLAGMPEPTITLYLQPVWCFSGRYTDGTHFEIFVPALTDDYLLPEPEE